MCLGLRCIKEKLAAVTQTAVQRSCYQRSTITSKPWNNLATPLPNLILGAIRAAMCGASATLALGDELTN